jgi:hypothetical protein
VSVSDTAGPAVPLREQCGARCWFAYYGWVGSSAPTCRRCGHPNPRYDVERDPYAGEGLSRDLPVDQPERSC